MCTGHRINVLVYVVWASLQVDFCIRRTAWKFERKLLQKVLIMAYVCLRMSWRRHFLALPFLFGISMESASICLRYLWLARTTIKYLCKIKCFKAFVQISFRCAENFLPGYVRCARAKMLPWLWLLLLALYMAYIHRFNITMQSKQQLRKPILTRCSSI